MSVGQYVSEKAKNRKKKLPQFTGYVKNAVPYLRYGSSSKINRAKRYKNLTDVTVALLRVQ